MKYIHGGDIYRNQVEYDFSVNINPMGMPVKSIEAAHEGIVLSGRYPDYKCERLCQEIGRFHGIDQSYAFVGNGAAELIYTLCYTLRPQRALVLAPTFQEYEGAIKAAGGKVNYCYLSEENDFDVDEGVSRSILGMLHGNQKQDILFVCNPNNPTGRIVKKDILIEIIRECQAVGTRVCVDESFLPFVEEENKYSLIYDLQQFSNLIVLRSFTKIYGMPGLRLGYVLSADRVFLDDMREKCQPWSVSVPAQLAGIAALRDEAFLEKTVKLIKEGREFLVQELLPHISDKYFESKANFILFKGDAGLQNRLLEEGILIRNCENFQGLDRGFYRIAVRSISENKEFVRRVKRWQR